MIPMRGYDDGPLQDKWVVAVEWLSERWLLHPSHSPVRKLTREEWDAIDLEQVAKEMQQ